MRILRALFLAAILGCFIVSAWFAQWEGQLVQGNHTWIVDLERAPVWAPPELTTYAEFQEVFTGSEDFPVEEALGLSVRRVLKLEWMAVELLLCLWLVTLIAGLLYLSVRGWERDITLQCALAVGTMMTLSGLVCIGLWLLQGGWGPPAPELFGGIGLAGGLLSALARRWASRVRAAAAWPMLSCVAPPLDDPALECDEPSPALVALPRRPGGAARPFFRPERVHSTQYPSRSWTAFTQSGTTGAGGA